MERQEIEIFLALAEELHFGRTAERVGVSQSRVSQTIARLERRIGARLFERTSRHVTLTPIGARLRDEVGPAQRRIDEAVARATAAGRGITGTLRIGFSGAFTGHLLHDITEVFGDRYPGVEVLIRQVQISDPYGPLRSGDIDLQVSELPIQEADLRSGPVLLSQERVLLMSADHPFAARDVVSVEDLAEATLLTVARPVPAHWLDHHFPRQTPSGRPIPHGQAITHWEDALSLVLAGKGVTPVSAAGVRYYARPGLVFRPFSDAPRIEYAFVWPADHETGRLRAFVNTAVERVRGLGGPARALDRLWQSGGGTG
ncbi:LysR family transcriptional regulator [Streptomyces sp. 3MP-14]|uniref:LysR family transcriptional regulator n=1 Tax=Streptomyces mimosae TaxID=2586635 RepID=A0A5N6A0K3_9ACTN|nr:MULTISPECIES: LysR family transcriptional regulator [Streptomyces]KAB8162271.1 LysR family transcriptional regulator [Streptomyces mimosae]KAB8173830.1 LysR family transcriptional regulator [Streptomyces sp. 3MP-14]